MEANCDWLLNKLQAHSPENLNIILEKHRARQDSFDLNEVLEFLPETNYLPFTKSLHKSLLASLRLLQQLDSTQGPTELEKLFNPVKATAEIASIFILNRNQLPVPDFCYIIHELHDVLLDLPAGLAQNQVAKMCEWYWIKVQSDRNRIVPQTILYLLLRSFGDETYVVNASDSPKRSRIGGRAADVKRVYAMRKCLDVLDLAPNSDTADTLRKLLLRCPTSASYLHTEEGKKFIAHLLTLEDIQEAVFDVLINQLTIVRKGTANLFGNVFLLAWKIQRSEWLVQKLTEITEKSMFAAAEPFGPNLRTILSTFHANKRANGVDLLLQKVYGPVLFRNLMVANETVRRNAVTILSDAFPIHDPGALMEDIESTLDFQCSKLVGLLEDPSPIVRRAAVQGSCRILGLLWEIVPQRSTKKMIDIITTKLAFDASSPLVRLAVFEGLSFLLDNHMAYQDLAVTLPQLGCLVHDKVERVRLAILDLLKKLKEKRIRTLRYFDVVPVEELLLRLPHEGSAGATKIMDLILSSYFPLEKSGKSAEEIASSQIRAYLSMNKSCAAAASYFYKHINLHVPPGPLCEFAMRLSTMALNAPLPEEISNSFNSRTKEGKEKGKAKAKSRKKNTRNRGKENENPGSIYETEDGKNEDSANNEDAIDRITLFGTVADILVSITPSLAKEKNKELRQYVNGIFGGAALKPLLVEQRGNHVLCRVATWRIASCIPAEKTYPIHTLWREQLDTILDRPTKTKEQCENYRRLLSGLILAGIKWKKVPVISEIVSGWSEAATLGIRTSRVASKAAKRIKQKNKGAKNDNSPASYAEELSAIRYKALFGLRACSSILLEDPESLNVLFDELSEKSDEGDNLLSLNQLPVIAAVRKGVIGALDDILENGTEETVAPSTEFMQSLLQTFSSAWKLALVCYVNGPDDTKLYEVREIIQWLTNVNLWKNATRLDETFADSLAAISLSYCADAVSLGFMNEVDLGHIKTIVSSLRNDLNLVEMKQLIRPVTGLLRISFHCREQWSYENLIGESSERKCSLHVLKDVSNHALSSSCWLLHDAPADEDRITGRLRKPETLDNFLGDVIVACQGEEFIESFQMAVRDPLVSAYVNSESAEQNLLASLVCNIVQTRLISNREADNSAAKELFSSLFGCMTNIAEIECDELETKLSPVIFSSYIASSCFETYSQNNSEPTQRARDVFDLMDSKLEELQNSGTADPELGDEIRNVKQTLTALRNLGNHDTSTNSVEPQNKTSEIIESENNAVWKSPDRKKTKAT